jgi:hypothetical protein
VYHSLLSVTYFSDRPDLQKANCRSHTMCKSKPIPVAGRSNARVCGCSLVGISGSNPAAGMDDCLLWVLYVVRLRSLRRADHSTREFLPSVVCLSVIRRGIIPLGRYSHEEKNTRTFFRNISFFLNVIVNNIHIWPSLRIRTPSVGIRPFRLCRTNNDQTVWYSWIRHRRFYKTLLNECEFHENLFSYSDTLLP